MNNRLKRAEDLAHLSSSKGMEAIALAAIQSAKTWDELAAIAAKQTIVLDSIAGHLKTLVDIQIDARQLPADEFFATVHHDHS